MARKIKEPKYNLTTTIGQSISSSAANNIVELAKQYEPPESISTYSINKEVTQTCTNVTEAGINAMIHDLDLGNFDSAVKMLAKMRQDSRLVATLNSRSFNLMDSDILVTSELKSITNDMELIQSAIDNAEQEIKVWYETGLMLGASLLQIIYSDTLINGKRPFILQNYKPFGLRYDLESDIYFLVTSFKNQSEDETDKRINDLKNTNGYASLAHYQKNYDVEIITGNPKWILYQTGNRGFDNGLIRPLVWDWYNKQLAISNLSNWSDKSAGPIMKLKVPVDSDPAANKSFSKSLKTVQSYGVIALPQISKEGPNYDVEYLETDSNTSYTAYENNIDKTDANYAITILSNNLSTEVTSGSLAATSTHRDKELMLAKSDKQYIQAIFQEQLLGSYAFVNSPEIEQATISFQIDTTLEMQDQLELLTTIQSVNNSIISQGYNIDMEKIIGATGITWLKKIEVIENDKPVNIMLAPTDIAKVVRVREARAASGLSPFGDERDDMTLSELDLWATNKNAPISAPITEPKPADPSDSANSPV